MGDSEIVCCQPFGIETLTKELVDCLKILRKISCCRYKHQYESIIKLAKYHLSYCINRMKGDSVRASKNDLKRDIFQTEVEAEQMQVRIAHIRQEWLHQQHTLAELEDCYYRKCQLLSAHSCYYSMQGSTLCSLINMVLYDKNALNGFLEEVKCFFNFLKIGYEFLYSYVSTYSAEPAVEDSSDYKFVMSLFSCIAKITSKQEARVMIIGHQNGQSFVWNLIHAIGRIKHNATLKLLAWMILHNLSKEEEGAFLLQGCNTFLVKLGDVLTEESETSILKYVLEIVERLSRDIPNKEYFKNFENNVKVHKLSQLGSDYKDIAMLPKRILRNLGRAAGNFLTQQNDDSKRLIPCVCTLSQHRLPDSISTSSISIKDVSDKGVQMCSTSVVKQNKKSFRKQKKRCVNNSIAPVNPVILPVLWKRKKSKMISPIIPVSFSKTGFSKVRNRRSFVSVGVTAEEIKTMLASNCSQTDDEEIRIERQGRISQEQIIKWPPCMEYTQPLPTARIINRVVQGTINKTQGIVNRIKIPRSFLQNRL